VTVIDCELSVVGAVNVNVTVFASAPTLRVDRFLCKCPYVGTVSRTVVAARDLPPVFFHAFAVTVTVSTAIEHQQKCRPSETLRSGRAAQPLE
jgi:hypothetical protein